MRLVPPPGMLAVPRPLIRLGAFAFPDWKAIVPTLAYSARALVAVGLALYLSFFFQLQTPMSSVTTVLIVANPVVGAMVSKSFWRIFGTVIGATAAVLLMAAFPQQPLLYFMGLSAIIGIACCVSTLLRFYKAYAAVLTGYTIVLISVSAFADPDNIFMAAMSRLSAVTIGIVSTAVVFLVTSISRPEKVLRQVDQTLRGITGQFSRPADLVGTTPGTTPMPDDGGQPLSFRAMTLTSYDARARLLSQANALVEAIEYAAADNFAIGRRANGLRAGVARLLGLLSTHHPVWHDQPSVNPQSDTARQVVQDVMATFANTPPEDLHLDDPGHMRQRIGTAIAALDLLTEETHDLRTIAFIDNERDVLVQLRAALDDFVGPQHPARPIRLRPFFDWPAALRNGARGVFVTMLGCLIWYVFRWSNGASMLTYLIPASCLLATSPMASRASGLFASGTLAALPAAFICQAVFLPRIDGYPLLWLSLAVCLLPGIWIQFHPRHAMRGFGYAVFFNAMVQIRNPISYDDLSLMNLWLSYLIALIGLALVFRVILPADNRLDSGRLVMSINRATQRLARLPLHRQVDWTVWENLQMQRILRLIQRFSLVAPPPRVYETTDAAFVCVSVGRQIARLRRLAVDPAVHARERARTWTALDAFRHLCSRPDRTARALRMAARDIMDRVEDLPAASHVPTRRIAACLEQASLLVDATPGFFHKHGPLQLPGDRPGANNRLNIAIPPDTSPFGMKAA